MEELELRSPEHYENLIKEGENLHNDRTKRYDEAYDVYRGTIKRAIRKESWESDLRVKFGMQVIDIELVNLIGGSVKAHVLPRRSRDVESAPKMEAILNYHLDEDGFDDKLVPFTQQSLIYGPSIAKNQWFYKSVPRLARRFMPGMMGGYVEFEVEEDVVVRDGPTFEPWDIYDAWWDPDGKDVDSCRYFVLRSWMSKRDIIENSRSESNPYGMFDVPPEFFDEAPHSGGRQMSSQERVLGSHAEKRKDKYEILEIWHEEPRGLHMCILANRKHIFAQDVTPFWHNHKPIVMTQTRPDVFDLEGIASTELLRDLQLAMWDLQNLRMDNMLLTVARGYTYREGGITNPKGLIVKPRFFWPVMDHEDIRPLDVNALPPEAYREDEVLLARMQLVTGINPYVSGADLASVDQNTATGVTALQEVASRLLKFKARQVSRKGIQPSLKQWGELVQQFMTEEQEVQITGSQPGTRMWAQYTPREVIGNYDYDVEGAEESISRQQERQEAVTLLNAFGPFLESQLIDPVALLRKVAKAYDIEPDELIKPAPPAPAPAAPTNQNPNGQPTQTLTGGQPLPPQIMDAINRGHA